MLQPMAILSFAPAATTETSIQANPTRVIKIVNVGAVTNTGTLSLFDSKAVGDNAAAKFVVGTTGVDFGANGVAFAKGLTAKNSVAGDQWGIVYGPRI